MISKIYSDDWKRRIVICLMTERLEEADFSRKYPFSYGDVKFEKHIRNPSGDVVWHLHMQSWNSGKKI